MNTAKLSEKVEFWHVPELVQNGKGDITGTPTKLFECRAEIQQMRGMARMMALQMEVTTPYIVKTRYYPTIANMDSGEIRWKEEKLRFMGKPENMKMNNKELIFYANS